MYELLAPRAGGGTNDGWLLSWRLANSALAAVCLLFAYGTIPPAQADEDNGTAGESVSVFSPTEVDTEQDGPRPLAFKPFASKALTPADLPPPNPFSNSFPRSSGLTFSRDWRAGANEYRAIIERASTTYGLPPALLDAVMAVESRYNPAAVGMDGEIGLMQVMPATARMLGFTGTQAQLADSETNIQYGAKYLAGAWRLAGQDICTAAMKYRAGHGETRFSYLSVDYCVRIRNHLVARGVDVTGTVPRPTFGTPAGAQYRGRAMLGRGGGANLASLNERLRALTNKIAPQKFR